MDGFEYPANFVPRYRKSLEAMRDLGLRYMFDPVTYRLAYSSFALTQGLVDLPYVIDKDNVMTPNDLRTLPALQKYGQRVIDWQNSWGCSTLVAPFHFCRDLASEWLDIDIKLIEESKSYAMKTGLTQPVYAGLSLTIETYSVKNNRLALLNRYSRGRADGYLFYVDSFDERTNNPLQIRSYLDLLSIFQNLDKPVSACRVGTLGLGFLCAGVDGMTSGIASLSSFSENDLLENRSTGYNMKRKYYIPDLMLTLPVEMAQDILGDRRNAHLRCQCVHCQGASAGFDRFAKPHFLRVRTAEVTAINGLGGTKDRLAWFNGRVANAISNCEQIQKQNIVNLKAGYFSHMKVWRQVFGS
jgi:serine/threonine-protein kinase